MENTNNSLSVSSGIKNTIANITDFKSSSELLAYCEHMISSGFLASSIKKPEQALVICQLGAELGLPMMAALNNINVIQGKPVLGWRVQVALVQRYGVIIDIVEDYVPVNNAKGEFKGNYRTTVEITREYKLPSGKMVLKQHRYSKEFKEICLMGLNTKDNWQRMPRLMLKARCTTDAIAVYCGDLLNGVYTVEEMAEVVDINYTTDDEGTVTLYDENGEETQVID